MKKSFLFLLFCLLCSRMAVGMNLAQSNPHYVERNMLSGFRSMVHGTGTTRRVELVPQNVMLPFSITPQGPPEGYDVRPEEEEVVVVQERLMGRRRRRGAHGLKKVPRKKKRAKKTPISTKVPTSLVLKLFDATSVARIKKVTDRLSTCDSITKLNIHFRKKIGCEADHEQVFDQEVWDSVGLFRLLRTIRLSGHIPYQILTYLPDCLTSLRITHCFHIVSDGLLKSLAISRLCRRYEQLQEVILGGKIMNGRINLLIEGELRNLADRTDGLSFANVFNFHQYAFLPQQNTI